MILRNQILSVIPTGPTDKVMVSEDKRGEEVVVKVDEDAVAEMNRQGDSVTTGESLGISPELVRLPEGV